MSSSTEPQPVVATVLVIAVDPNIEALLGELVVFAGHQPEYGVTLIVDHGHDVKTLYGHLSRATVSVGDRVQRGEVMAYTGNTGRSSGPHLHYEIQVAGQPVDPRGFLWD